jgi:hypothetical protein
MGYRIITNNYVIVSGYGGLVNGQTFITSKMVSQSVIETFRKVAAVAEEAKEANKEIAFSGSLAKTGEKSKIFEGKQVIILHSDSYENQNYPIIRKS